MMHMATLSKRRTYDFDRVVRGRKRLCGGDIG